MAATALVRSVFLDVVGFTRGRTVEAQTEIVGRLNKAVGEVLEDLKVEEKDRIVIPTGDGLCISLIDVLQPFDLPMQLAIAILQKLQEGNATEEREERQFDVRIGINENHDNVVMDFNERRNIAGAGISLAQRVMDKADGRQILVSESTHRTLAPRDRYFGKFRRFFATTKHGERLEVYQFVDSDVPGLNTELPKAFTPREERKDVLLSEVSARHLALAEYYEDAIAAQLRRDSTAIWYVPVALAFMAEDEASIAGAPSFEEPHIRTRGGDTIREVFEYYAKGDPWVALYASERLAATRLSGLSACFETGTDGLPIAAIVSAKGRAKLEAERPDLVEALRTGEWKPRIGKD